MAHPQLRDYQTDIYNRVTAAWVTGYRAVMVVLPTGAGKTVTFSHAIHEHQGMCCAIAHRQELVSQMSIALARYEVKHRVLSPENVVRSIIQQHIIELKRDYVDPSARCAVAGVDTVMSWAKPEHKQHYLFKRWAAQVTLVIMDEGHHTLTANKWGKVLALFPNARVLLVTATPERADGKGLGRHADGIVDVMLEGPGMRELIHRGFLTDYRVFCPPSDLDLSTVGVGVDGDLIRAQLAKATRKSTVMGHVVEHYQRIAPGKLGVTFAPDVETAVEFAVLFNQAGVPAEVVSAKTPDNLRREIINRFKRRELLQLVNVDLFGEGFDLPAIEVVTMARATQSYALFAQQFGRALRPMDGKSHAIIIDHVGNVLRHGLPDRPRVWTLDRRERSAKRTVDPEVIPMRVCCNPVCMSPFEKHLDACPFCGWVPVPVGRSKPEQVDGCLYELEPEVLAAMRCEVAKVDEHPDAVRAWMSHSHDLMTARAAAKRQREKQDQQAALRESMAWYGGVADAAGLSHRETQRKFYLQFGVDVLSAMALGRAEAEALTGRINQLIGRTV